MFCRRAVLAKSGGRVHSAHRMQGFTRPAAARRRLAARFFLELVVRALLLAVAALLIDTGLRGFGLLAVPWGVWLALGTVLFVLVTLGLMSAEHHSGGSISIARWSRLSPQQKLRRMASASWSTPVLLFPLWVLAVLEPSLLREYWQFWLLLYGVPSAVATALYLIAHRADRRAGKSARR